jgi:hypothetical protein
MVVPNDGRVSGLSDEQLMYAGLSLEDSLRQLIRLLRTPLVDR